MLHVLVISSQQAFLDDGTIVSAINDDGIPVKKILLRYGSKLSTKRDLACDIRTKAFHDAEERISAYLQDHDIIHDRFLGILHLPRVCDYYHPDDIHALRRPEGALILAFPEILWIPVYGDNNLVQGNDIKGTMTLHQALSLMEGGYSPLFDGDGLRSCLMARIRNKRKSSKRKADETEKSGSRCDRTDAAIAVDEERHFAYMNAYTAYRFGYRAYPVTTLSAAKALLQNGRDGLLLTSGIRNYPNPTNDAAKFIARIIRPRIVVFEDAQLQFPDAENGRYEEEAPAFGVHRDDAYRLLKEADLRVVATASRPEEAIAETENNSPTNSKKKPDKTTVEKYFRGRGNGRSGRYRSLQGSTMQERVNRFSQLFGNRLSRWWFNICRGWVWHCLVKTLDVLLTAGILIGMLFFNASYFLPALLGVFVVRGALSSRLQKTNEKMVWLPEGVRKALVGWSQWRFLPKRYRNHYVENLIGKSSDTYWTVVHKPLAGIFGLRNACCLPNGHGFQGIYDTARVKEECRRVRQGDFVERNSNENITHSAPGMALEIAVRLLRRAEWLVAEDKIIDAEGAIHGAVLATVAGELLDSKTPAVSIEALTWKQYFEIRSECEFVGVQAHPDMVDRYIDIHNAVRRICQSPDGLVREEVYNSGMAELMDKLSDLLSGKGKREEAQFFAKKARMFHRRLMNPIVRTVLSYPEWLLRSAWHVVIGLAVLVAVFCVYLILWEQSDLNMPSALSRTYEVLFCDEPDLTGKNSVVIRTARIISMLHLAFLGLCFWDSMQRK